MSLKRKKIILAAVMLPFFFTTSAQQADKCLTGVLFTEWSKKHPALFEKRMNDEKNIQGSQGNKTTGVVRVIPVVFHVIHEGGAENISKAQILDQIEILNRDLRRLNADTVNTPPPFQALGADCEIELRLAQIDPNGNCTDGIVRVFSPLTHSAGDNVKALSSWDNSSYLNFWTVKSIYNWTGGPGIILGYAYYPGTAPPGADGVVIRSDYTGSIGAIGFGNVGRTATHEVGHYLNLIHMWGDSPCGDDQVFDTPTSQGPNYGCVGFPHITCGNGPNGDLFTDYMDYADDACMNIFTWGQKARMDATLAGFRSFLISPANLMATGTNGVPPVPCTLVPDFYADKYSLCTGGSVNFNDASWNGDATAWSWNFQGGTPSNSNVQNPAVQYNTPGTYYVTLSVSNAAGIVTLTKTGFIKVYPAVANYITPYTEDFETVLFPSADWEVENNGGGSAWAISADASVSGVKSVKLDNFSGNIPGSTDVFITPAYDFSNIGNVSMTFKLASAGTDTLGSDNLRVYVTVNCGQTWSLRYNKTGNGFYTAGIVPGNFIPVASQWRTETLALGLPQFTGQPNVKFKFIYTHDSANNIFIDDINITGIPLGIEYSATGNVDFEIYPNPAVNYCELRISDLRLNGKVELSMCDITGREVYKQSQVINTNPQTYLIPSPGNAGVYLLTIKAGNIETRKKIMFLEN